MMKNIILLLCLALAATATAQQLTIEPTGKKFILTSTFTKDNGEVLTRRTQPLDTARARAEIASFAGGLGQQIAELQLQINRLTAEQAKANQAYIAIDGVTTLEDDLTVKASSLFVGRYAFTKGGVADTLIIEKKAAGKPNERLVAELQSGGTKGTLKIEAQTTAVILALFKDSLKKKIDVKMTLVEADLFVAELEGEKIAFTKLPPPPAAKNDLSKKPAAPKTSKTPQR